MSSSENTTYNEQSSTKDRLLKYIESKHLNASQFLEMTGLSKTYISNMRKSIKPSTFDNNIAPAFPDLNKIWLLYGEGNMLNTSSTFNQKKEDSFEDLTIDNKLNILYKSIIDYNKKLSAVEFKLQILSSISTKAFELLFENFDMETLDTEAIEKQVRIELNSEQ